MVEKKSRTIQRDLADLVINTTIVCIGSAVIYSHQSEHSFMDELTSRQTLVTTACFYFSYLGWKLGRRTMNYFKDR